MIEISVKDFTLYPGPRYKTQGEHSAEEFYLSIVKPAYEKAIKENTKLLINLDGVAGYFPSFFDEVFGRLTQKYGKVSLHKNLKFISEDEPDRVDTIFKIIDHFHTNGFSNSVKNKYKSIIQYSDLNKYQKHRNYLFIGGYLLLTIIALIFLSLSLIYSLQKNDYAVLFYVFTGLAWLYTLLGLHEIFVFRYEIGYYLSFYGFIITNIIALIGIICITTI